MKILGLMFIVFFLILGGSFLLATFSELDRTVNVSEDYLPSYNYSINITQLSITNLQWMGYVMVFVMIIAALLLFAKLIH